MEWIHSKVSSWTRIRFYSLCWLETSKLGLTRVFVQEYPTSVIESLSLVSISCCVRAFRRSAEAAIVAIKSNRDWKSDTLKSKMANRFRRIAVKPKLPAVYVKVWLFNRPKTLEDGDEARSTVAELQRSPPSWKLRRAVLGTRTKHEQFIQKQSIKRRMKMLIPLFRPLLWLRSALLPPPLTCTWHHIVITYPIWIYTVRVLCKYYAIGYTQPRCLLSK